MSELISVCIPAYNAEQTIGDTLKSLICQTYRDIEIVVSDNASTDATVKIIEGFSKNDPRIRLLRSDNNIGYCKNIEKVVTAAGSEIVCVYHADDIYEPSIVEKEARAMMDGSGASAVFVALDNFAGSIDNRLSKNSYNVFENTILYNKQPNYFLGGIKEYTPIILEYGNIFACSSLMTLRGILLGFGGFRDDKYPSCEDLELWIKYLRHGEKLCIVNECLLHYRLSDTQGSAYWDKHLDVPVVYSLIENELLGPGFSGAEALGKYRKRKSSAIIGKALLAAKAKNLGILKTLLRKSRQEYRFSPWTKNGVLQISAGFDLFLYGYLLVMARKIISK
jgi:glycosyltransferase involved in cell wall biosynthesis